MANDRITRRSFLRQTEMCGALGVAGAFPALRLFGAAAPDLLKPGAADWPRFGCVAIGRNRG